MPTKDKVKQRQYQTGYQRRRREEHKFFVSIYKQSVGCVDCGYNLHSEALEFDHIDSSNKSGEVSQMVNGSISLVRIFEEINKCEVVCANCHRVRTFNRR